MKGMKKDYPQLNAWSKAKNSTIKRQNSLTTIRKNNRPSNKKLTNVRRHESRNPEKRK